MTEEQYKERVVELIDELKSSLNDSIHVLTALLEDVSKGNYTQTQAQLDYELLMWNDGLNYMSVLGDLANIGQYA